MSTSLVNKGMIWIVKDVKTGKHLSYAFSRESARDCAKRKSVIHMTKCVVVKGIRSGKLNSDNEIKEVV